MKTKLILSSTLLVIFLLIMACKKTEATSTTKNVDYSSTPVLPETPDNYVASTNDHLAALGRVLFYDKNLSLNNTVACATCHQQSKAFCDNLQFSTGLQDTKTSRNAPTIFAKNSRLFWDGRASSISDLVLKPVQNHVEMNFQSLQDLANKLATINYYPELFNKAFGSSDISQARIRQALTEFLMNFNFSNNKFNKSTRNQEALNATEAMGKAVFFGKGLCFNCHHVEASALNIPFDSLNINVGGGYGNTDESHNIGLDDVYSDNGIGSLDNNPVENGVFMVPALLNVEFTAPYMHDGRYKTLDEVVEHYNSGIQNHPNLDPVLRGIDVNNLTDAAFIKKYDTNKNGFVDNTEIESIPPVKLNLSSAEKRALVEFLKTLSDASIFTDRKFGNPFVKN